MMNFLRTNIRRIRDLINYLKMFRKRGDLYFVRNRNTLERVFRDEVSGRMKQKYSRLIDAGVNPTTDSVKSNIVWMCWLQGEENAPDIVKASINSVRKNLQDREVIVLTEESFPEYVQLPEHIMEKRAAGMIGPAHFADLLRLELLCKYGGMWVDATVLCTGSDIPKSIAEAPLFVYQAVDLTRKDQDSTIASNWLISAWSNHPILLLTRDLLYEYWKTEDQAENYFIFHILFAIAARRYEKEWKSVPVFNNQSPHILQFEMDHPFIQERWEEIMNMSVFHKLNRRKINSPGVYTFYHHILALYGETGENQE